jgi:hypothetical protein
MRVQSAVCCVAYDKTSGKIHHIHEAVTMEGAEETPRDHIERAALALAGERGHDVGSLAVLFVDSAQFEPRVRYRVDVRSRALVQEDEGSSAP